MTQSATHVWFIAPMLLSGLAGVVGGGLTLFYSDQQRARTEFSQIYLTGQIKEASKSAFVGSSISALAVVFETQISSKPDIRDGLFAVIVIYFVSSILSAHYMSSVDVNTDEEKRIVTNVTPFQLMERGAIMGMLAAANILFLFMIFAIWKKGV